MLQFEFDIRDYKLNNNEAKSSQLAWGIAFFIFTTLFLKLESFVNLYHIGEYIAIFSIVCCLYFSALIFGCKYLYPKEYLHINFRKIEYKVGWKNKKIKIYFTDIHDIRIENDQLVFALKNKEEISLCISMVSPKAIRILKSYLNLSE